MGNRATVPQHSPHMYTCDVCDRQVSKRQSKAVADGKRACKKHTMPTCFVCKQTVNKKDTKTVDGRTVCKDHKGV
jgi:hypothetical protein